MTDKPANMSGTEAAVNRSSQREVYIKVVFTKIGEIETMKEQYHADICVQARWKEKSLDHSTNSDKDVNFSQYWDPKLSIQNKMGTPKQSSWKVVRYGKEMEAYIVQKFQIKGIFSENLELQDFPFDIQKLSVIITSELPDKDLKLVEDDKDLSLINVQCFVDAQEWTLYDYTETIPWVTTKEQFLETTVVSFPGIAVSCTAARRSGFFIWNIMLMMFMISSLSITTFAVDRILPQNRLQLSLTLVLVAVTFRFVANQILPKISYLTILDQYILTNMTFMYLVCIWHAVISLFDYDKELAGDMDYYAFITLISSYGAFQLIYTILVILKRYSKGKLLDQKVLQYNAKAKSVMGESWMNNREEKGRRMRARRARRIGITHHARPV
ncbi:hypothetical protein ScPMuIL_002702 [Solemya velum]